MGTLDGHCGDANTHGVHCIISCGTGKKLDGDDAQPYVDYLAKVVRRTKAVALFATRVDRITCRAWSLGPVMLALANVGGFLGDSRRGVMAVSGMESLLTIFQRPGCGRRWRPLKWCKSIGPSRRRATGVFLDVSIARHERNTPMTHHDFDLSEVLSALQSDESGDLVRQMVSFLYQALIDAEATEVVQAERHERSLARTTQRNGSRPRLVSTKAGDVELKIPKLRKGSFFPSVLERRRRIDQALYAVVMEAYVHGISTRKVDDLVAALGVNPGISKSEVSRICAQLDEEMNEFRTRNLSHLAFPYLLRDATYVKARVGGRVDSRAVVVATGVGEDTSREMFGVAIGDSEDAASWTEFLQSLRERGLHGVQLVISDSHLGLKAAIAKVFPGASWQRCRVHFMRNVLVKLPKNHQQMVAAMIRTIFAQPDALHVERQVKEVAATMKRQIAVVTEMLLDAGEDVTAFRHFPTNHWQKIWSTNSLERLNAEIKRRTNVVGIFPNDAAALRLITAVVVEQLDEWSVSERRYLSQESMDQLKSDALTSAPVALAKFK
jgi:putative transposase